MVASKFNIIYYYYNSSKVLVYASNLNSSNLKNYLFVYCCLCIL